MALTLTWLWIGSEKADPSRLWCRPLFITISPFPRVISTIHLRCDCCAYNEIGEIRVSPAGRRHLHLPEGKEWVQGNQCCKRCNTTLCTLKKEMHEKGIKETFISRRLYQAPRCEKRGIESENRALLCPERPHNGLDDVSHRDDPSFCHWCWTCRIVWYVIKLLLLWLWHSLLIGAVSVTFTLLMFNVWFYPQEANKTAEGSTVINYTRQGSANTK